MTKNILKINELAKNILLSIVSIIIFLVIFEFLLRFFHFGESMERIEPVILMKSSNGKIFYEMKPNSYMMRDSVNITINSKGMRDIGYAYNKPNGTYRIAVIGDSVTSAVYLNLSQVYTEILERKLNSIAKRYGVLNFGVNGYDTLQEVEVLKTKALKFNPDMIIVGYVLNDPFPSDAIIGFFNRIDDRKQSACKIPLISLRMPCALADFINNLKTIKFAHEKWLNIKAKFEDDFYTALYSKNSTWQSLSDSFKEIDSAAKKKNIKVVVVIFPILKNLQDYKWAEIHSRVAQRAEKNGFYVIDILDEYKKYKDEELKIQDTDIYHPNRLGHEIAADAIYKRLLNVINVSSS